MKAIRIVDGYAYPSTVGPNVFINVLSTELAKRGHQCIVYSTTTGNEALVIGEINGYQVKNYKPLFRLWSFPVSVKLIIDVLRARPDIIHVHGYRSFHCSSCGGEFRYQHLKASNCPECGALLEDDHGIRQDYDDYHTDHPRI